jgi:hypothetical protein
MNLYLESAACTIQNVELAASLSLKIRHPFDCFGQHAEFASGEFIRRKQSDFSLWQRFSHQGSFCSISW